MSSEWKAGELADAIRNGDVDANIAALMADDTTTGGLLLAAERAGLDPDTSPLIQLLERQTNTDTLRGARKAGDAASMTAATGLSERRIEATGYEMLISRCKPAAQQILIKGPKGSGKTTKALDIVRNLYTAFDGELKVWTNIKGPDDHEAVTFGEGIAAALEWVRDTDGEKIMVGDEWSTTVNAHAAGGGNVRQTFSQFINALRKGQGGSTRLLAIGHEHDTDLAAIIRNQSDVVIRADGKKDEGMVDKATVYDGWKAYQQDDPAFMVRGLEDVPESSVWGADTNYFAHFEMDLDDPGRQIQRGRLVENWEDYQDGASDDDQEDAREQCSGSKANGDPCYQLTEHPSGYCGHHRHQADGADESEGEA